MKARFKFLCTLALLALPARLKIHEEAQHG